MSTEHFVPNLHPTPGERQRAGALALLMICGCVLLLPLAGMRMPRLEAFVLIIDTALTLVGLLTAVLLYARFSVTRSPAVLALACGFLLVSLTTAPQLLREAQGAFVDVRLQFIADLALGVAAIAYALLRRGVPDTVDSARTPSHIAGGVAATVAIAALAIWITAASTESGMDAPGEAALVWRVLATGVACVALGIAIALIWRRRASALDLWLLVALVAWLIDLLLRGVAPDGASVAWQFARLYGLLGAACMMQALLVEALSLRLRRGRAEVAVEAVANELSQPLCAIIANADAISRMLEHQRPDLGEVRAALADIVNDAGRASETLRDARRSPDAGEGRSKG